MSTKTSIVNNQPAATMTQQFIFSNHTATMATTTTIVAVATTMPQQSRSRAQRG
jgi:hypothetical protein